MAIKTRSQARKRDKGFPIFSLPEKAFKEILNEMDSLTLLELSLLSKRCFKAVKDCSIKGRQLVFRSNPNSDCILLFGDNRDTLKFQFKKHNSNGSSFRKVNGVLVKNWKIEYHERGLERQTIVVKCYLGSEAACAIFNHLSDLFEIENLEYTVASEKLKMFHKNVMNKLPRTLDTLKIGSQNSIGRATTWNVLMNLNIKKSLVIMCSVRRLLKEIRDIEIIHINKAEKIPLVDFLQLNCKELIITHHQLTCEAIKVFIRKWLNSETKLEVLKVNYHHSKNDLNVYLILEGFNPQPWDRKKRNRFYHGIDCAEYMDIQRESDGAMASLGYDEKRYELVFISWENQPYKIKPKGQTFPLYSLPHVALKMVMERMETVDVFEVSLLSKKSKACIKSCSIPMEKLEFNPDSIYITSRPDCYNLILNLNAWQRKTSSSRTVNDCRFNMWTKKNFDEYYINCNPSHPDGIFIAFQHLHDLFRYEKIKYQCDTEDHKFINEAMRKLPRDVTDLEIEESERDKASYGDQVDTILDYYGAVNSLELGDFLPSFSDRIQNMDSIHLEKTEGLPFESLFSLNCKTIYIGGSKHELTNENIIDWIKKWQKGELRLEQLIISYSLTAEEENKVEDGFDLKKIREGLNGKMCKTLLPFGGRVRDYVVVKRDQDGLRASIQNDHEEELEFNVWTEKFMKDNKKMRNGYGYDFRQDS